MLKDSAIICIFTVTLSFFSQEYACSAELNFQSTEPLAYIYMKGDDINRIRVDRMLYDTVLRKWTFIGGDLRQPFTIDADDVNVWTYLNMFFISEKQLVIKNYMSILETDIGVMITKDPGRKRDLAKVRHIQSDKYFRVPEEMQWRADIGMWEFPTPDAKGDTGIIRQKDEDVEVILDDSISGLISLMHASATKLCLGRRAKDTAYTMCVSKSGPHKWLFLKN